MDIVRSGRFGDCLWFGALCRPVKSARDQHTAQNDLRPSAQNGLGFCYSLDHLRLLSRIWRYLSNQFQLISKFYLDLHIAHRFRESAAVMERILTTRPDDLLRLPDPLRLPCGLLLCHAETVLLHTVWAVHGLFRLPRRGFWIGVSGVRHARSIFPQLGETCLLFQIQK